MVKILKSLYNGFRGIKLMIITQRNAQIHTGFTLLGLALGAYFPIKVFEWLAILSAMGLVWVAEAFNTVAEWLVDEIHPHYNQNAGFIKDMAAGGVLLASIFAAAIGLVTFVPEFLNN